VSRDGRRLVGWELVVVFGEEKGVELS